MYKLLDGNRIVATSTVEIPYDPQQKAWKIGDSQYVDINKNFTVAKDPTRVEFKLRFTTAERLAIQALKSTDAVVSDFFSLLDDPGLLDVELSLQATKDGATYCINAVRTQLGYSQADADLRISAVLSYY